jgi:hypothetical protein
MEGDRAQNELKAERARVAEAFQQEQEVQRERQQQEERRQRERQRIRAEEEQMLAQAMEASRADMGAVDDDVELQMALQASLRDT